MIKILLLIIVAVMPIHWVKIGIFLSRLKPVYYLNQNGIHRNLVRRFNRSAYGSLLFHHYHFKARLYIVNK
ncbi:hypothetical protein DLR74_00120 [Vibrio paracholerae]|nr:hypothetical protein DLR74_00120 [Vibrio paracholerae]RNE57436.1 hypothetical protein EEJ33_14975 [Vibrio cholerae]